MSQIIINTGNIANDGTGDPLRTAFNDVNNNFTQVFSAGPVGSNIAIANNTIQTTNTNGNLILATNGVGVVVPAANFVPDRPNTRSIGTSADRFSTVYAQYLNANSGTFSGNIYAGNMHFTGNVVTVNYSTANIGNLNLTLAANASNAALANGAGIIVANANANLIYNYSSNSWDSSIAITAPTFIGDGANLTNVVANVNAINLLGTVLSSSVTVSNLTSFGSVTSLSAIGDISTTGNVYANAIVGNTIFGALNGDGSNITNITANAIVGNVPFALNANSAYTANLAALATQAINADTALFAINANLAAFSNVATSAQTANSSQYAVQSDNANSAVVAGMAYELSPSANVSLTGNIQVGGILTNGYYYANGTPFTGATSNVSNLVNGNAIFSLTSDGVLNLPVGHSYSYNATLTGYGSNTAQIHFNLVCDQSGTQTEWQAGITNPGNGYSVGQTFTYDSTFIGIPNASVSIEVASVNGSGGVTNLAFTQPPLYPPSFYQSNSFIALEANTQRWTFGLNGNLTLPATITGLATAVTLNAGLTVGYSTAANVPTIADTGTGTGLTVDIIADSGNAGSITSVTLNQRGQGYAPGDQLTINQPSSTGNGELTVVAVETVNPSINYANGTPFAGGGNFTGNINAVNVTATGNVSAGNLYIGNTLFTRTLLVGTWTAPVTVPLASNNSFNVLTANGSSNIVVYTT